MFQWLFINCVNDFKVFFKGVARIFDVLSKEFHWCSKTVLRKIYMGFQGFSSAFCLHDSHRKKSTIFFCDCV